MALKGSLSSIGGKRRERKDWKRHLLGMQESYLRRRLSPGRSRMMKRTAGWYDDCQDYDQIGTLKLSC